MFTATPENLLLLKVILLLVLVVHLAFAAAVVGGTTVSLVLAFFGRQDENSTCLRLARKTAEAVMPSRSVVPSLCLTLAIALVTAWIGYSPGLFSAWLWGALVALLLLGLALVYAYRHLLVHDARPTVRALLTGAAGLSLLLVVYFLICCGGALLQMPYTWPHLNASPQLALSWTGVAHFLEFILIGLAFTGAGMRLFAGLALQRDRDDPDYLRSVMTWGNRLALAAMLLLPPIIFFDLINLPQFALSASVFVLTLAALALTALLALPLTQGGDTSSRTSGKWLMGGALGVLALLVLADHSVREEALAKGSLPLPKASAPPSAKAQEPEKEESTDQEPEQQKQQQKQVEPSAPAQELVQKGQEVFNSRCASCHKFDSRMVGPPLNDVLPDYRNDRQALEDFIRNPVKKNPDYPSMPDLDLSDREIEAVAAFLLSRLKS